MKRMIGNLGLAMVVGFSFTAAHVRGDEVPDTSAPIVSDTTTSGPIDTPAAFPAAPAPAPTEVQLTPGAGEIAKLAQGGLGDPVMLAYIGNARSKFNLGSDQIVYLNDLGVSSDVVKAMIERDASLDAASRAAVAELTHPPTQDPPPTDPSTADNSDTSAPPVDLSNYASGTDADYFYNSLQPYGSWTYIGGYGLCWQPTVCIGNHDWRPYADRGRWLDSDCGWYWQSDYSWGWAAFHYGRWFNVANRGWVWAPDRVWGPAWVSWRHSADYAGWAPLPPTARFVPGAGLVYRGAGVGLNFEFGLSASLFTFIPIGRLSDYAPARYAVTSWQAGQVFGQTRVANHFATVNGHAVNRSIDAREVSRLAGTEIRHVEVRDRAESGRFATPSEQIAKRDGAMVIYRSQLPTPTASRVAAPSSTPPRQPNSTPSRSYPQPRTSAEPAHTSSSPYYSGSSPVYHPQSYPANSLVIIGSRNNSVAGRSSSSSGSYRVFDSVSPAPNHEVRVPDNQSAYVMPPRSSVSSRVSGDFVHTDFGDRSTHAFRNESRGDFGGYSGGQSHFDHHDDSHTASSSTSSHSFSGSSAASSSHASSSPASSSSSSSSSGKK